MPETVTPAAKTIKLTDEEIAALESARDKLSGSAKDSANILLALMQDTEHAAERLATAGADLDAIDAASIALHNLVDPLTEPASGKEPSSDEIAAAQAFLNAYDQLFPEVQAEPEDALRAGPATIAPQKVDNMLQALLDYNDRAAGYAQFLRIFADNPKDGTAQLATNRANRVTLAEARAALANIAGVKARGQFHKVRRTIAPGTPEDRARKAAKFFLDRFKASGVVEPQVKDLNAQDFPAFKGLETALKARPTLLDGIDPELAKEVRILNNIIGQGPKAEKVLADTRDHQHKSTVAEFTKALSKLEEFFNQEGENSNIALAKEITSHLQN